MPKEVSHRILADTGAQYLQEELEGGRAETLDTFHAALGSFPHLFRFASTCPDTIFYFAFLPCSGESRKLPERSHGASGPGSFAWIPRFRQLMAEAGEESDTSLMLRAFAAGILSHLAADHSIHPVVRHFAPTDRAHHLFEMRLDRYLMGEAAGPPGSNGEPGNAPLRLQQIATRAEQESRGYLFELFHHYANSFVHTDPVAIDRCRDAIALHCRIQHLFFVPLLRPLLALPSLIFPKKIGTYRDLIYHGPGGIRFFQSIHLRDLIDRARKNFLSFLEFFQDYLEGKAQFYPGPDADRGDPAWKPLQEEGPREQHQGWTYKRLYQELNR